jgi:predicted phage tail protein
VSYLSLKTLPNEIEITALAYRPDKYNAVEQNLVLQPLPTSITRVSAPPAPTNFKVTETLYQAGLGVVGVKSDSKLGCYAFC